jgi:radical SAM superfamily enzyme YgiQ (UPF0313 family)
MEAMAKMKILLLNPPGRGLYLRDYYCSKVSQADYLNHPVDLLFLSGWLKALGDLFLIDAVVDQLSVRESLRRISEIHPDVVVGLISSVSYQEDLSFYRQLRKLSTSRIALSGDILIDRRSARLEELEFADAFLHDFSTADLNRWISGLEPEQLENMTVRRRNHVFATPIPRPRGESLLLPVPRHSLFLAKPYRYPFVRHRRFATVMTEFGCPYRCNFCIMSTLGWKVRPVQGVLEELDVLASLEVPELLLLDQTFGIDQGRTHRLLKEMVGRRYGFGWVCFTRPDVVDESLATEMKQAGCHTVILGVESGDKRVLQSAQKDYGKDEIREGFALCRGYGLRTVATIILGLPEETRDSFEETLVFLQELQPDFVSVNVAVPRMGTRLRDRAIRLGLIDDCFEIMDQSGTTSAMPTLTLSGEQVKAMKKRAIREFYGDFRYLKARLLELARTGSLGEFQIHWRQGTSLLRNYLQ